ncbi:MAG: hypothetical protein CMJ33_06615 [Phycisphaerae bacterium]|nr:hypothetical protein [Phycisphaerae bacterium]
MSTSIASQLEGVHHGDCLDILPQVPANSVDLAYLDPPFATGRRLVGREGLAFDDHWATIDDWLAFITPRIRAVISSLTSTGSILIHCDWRTSHHVRFLLDDLLGPDCFQNHLVWAYGLGGSSPKRFARKHDDIIWYSARPDAWYFDPPMVPATSNRMRGRLKKATDVLDVPALNNMAKERNGWPTQKPLALLEILVRACSPVDGLVLDPMCGSGTTLVAAKNTERRWLGFDRCPDAVKLARSRLEAVDHQ